MAVAVDLGNQRIELIHFGEGHTRSDVIVFVPGENIVFLGDLIEEGADPQVDDTSNISNWPAVLDGALGATNDAAASYQATARWLTATSPSSLAPRSRCSTAPRRC